MRQLGVRFVETSELDERAAERDARGEVVGMVRKAGAADADGLVVIARAAALLGELRKSNRRRVRLDPASEFEKSWVIPVTRLSTARSSLPEAVARPAERRSR